MYALKGKEHVEWDNPHVVGMTGLIGFSSGYFAMNDCDVLLMLGTDLPYRQFYPQGGARIAKIDIRAEQLGRRAPIHLGLVGDVAATIDALLPLLTVKPYRWRLDQAVEHYRKVRKDLDDLAADKPGKKLIDPQQVARALSNLASDGAVLTCDVVESGIAAALAHNGPELVDAVVNRQELSMPPHISVEMAKGFTLYMLKAVMSGRADEVLDLAVTNLWR